LGKKEDAEGEARVRISGWILLIVSWAIILGLTTFCFLKVFSKKELK